MIQFIFPDVNGTKWMNWAERSLHSLKSPGMPDHNLKLKLNFLCLMMRNISVQDHVMNNTEVILREVGRKYMTVWAQTSSPLSHRVSVHLAMQPSDSGMKTIVTPPVLNDHGEQSTRPDTLKDLLWCERASVCPRTIVHPSQEAPRHLDADTASARRKGSTKNVVYIPRVFNIFILGWTSSPCIIRELPSMWTYLNPRMLLNCHDKETVKKRPERETASTWLRLEPTKSSILSMLEDQNSDIQTLAKATEPNAKDSKISPTVKMDTTERTLHPNYTSKNRKATCVIPWICKSHVCIGGELTLKALDYSRPSIG